jgi:transcriptional regulator with XRE-family HTH domain
MTIDPKSTRELRIRFAANLREQRQLQGLSQEVLAELAGLHRTYVSQVERSVTNVSLDNVDRLAVALGVDAHVLFLARAGELSGNRVEARQGSAKVGKPAVAKTAGRKR